MKIDAKVEALKDKWYQVYKRANGKTTLYIEDIVNVVGAAGFYELLEAKLIFEVEPLPNGEEQRNTYILANW